MSILVIGQSGQVARALQERAGARHTLTAFGRPELNLVNMNTIERVLELVRPRIVINAAAYTAVDKAESDVEAAFSINRDGPGRLAELCAARGLPIIHYSTDYVFDGSKDTPYSEADPTAPLGVYGQSKLAGEQAVSEATADHVILRTAWVYSPFGGNFVKSMLRLAGETDDLNIVANQIGCPTSALDIADATLSIADCYLGGKGKAGTYHLAGTGETSWHGFAEAIFETSKAAGGPSATVHPIPASDYPTPARRPANSRLDCRKLDIDYGLKLPHWRESMEVCIHRLLREASSS